MKNSFFGVLALFLVTFSSFAQTLQGEMKVNDYSYNVFNDYAVKYIKNIFQYNIKADPALTFEERSDGNNTILTDSYGNTITVQMISQTSNSLKFNLVGSNGKTIKDITYSSVNPISGRFCWRCVTMVVSAALDVLSDLFGPGSDCAIAINACVQSGGLPQTTISNGFFGADCSVRCLPKR